jgi:hypothetical protein
MKGFGGKRQMGTQLDLGQKVRARRILMINQIIREGKYPFIMYT